MKSKFKFRIRIFSGIIIAFAALLVVRLYFLQVVHGDDFKDKADHQYTRPSAYSFDRGTIYFTSKDGDLISGATIKDGFVVAAVPDKIQDSVGLCGKLSTVLTDLDCGMVSTRASKKGDPYEEIARKTNQEQADKILALDIPGIGIYKERWRVYPAGDFASHLLGLMGYKEDKFEGRYGLENYYEDILRRGGEGAYVNFFAEIFSNINKHVIKGEKLEGDIITTIEPTTQSYLENEIDGVMAQWGSESAGGIIMDPKTGEIYAMTLTPSFDPNDFKDVPDPAVFSNDLVEDVREMGSIIKVLTMATAIDLGLADASTLYNDAGSVTLNGKTIYNFDNEGRGTITMQEAFGKSLNTGFVHLSQKIGHDNMRKYFKSFGLGEKSGIDLPNEGRGLVDNLNSPRDIEYATASFGQGIAVTPVQAIRAISAVANGGVMVTPHLVKEIKYKIGGSKKVSYPEGERVIKEETSVAVTRMMVENFDTYFQDGKAKNPNYSIAEKTGTAQIAIPGGGGYYTDRNLHSFVGYLPAYDPKFLVFMYTVAPQGARYSSESLGPTFVDITKFLINYYDIPPDR